MSSEVPIAEVPSDTFLHQKGWQKKKHSADGRRSAVQGKTFLEGKQNNLPMGPRWNSRSTSFKSPFPIIMHESYCIP